MRRPKYFMFSLLLTAIGLSLGARGLSAQKALVVCPPSDAAGCERVAQTLDTSRAADGGRLLFPGGVDRRFEELRTMSPGRLAAYSVVFVPSFANAPYDLLREDDVREGLSLVLTGRVAVWSGTPDRGSVTGKSAGKLDLIRNLARWAAADYRRSGTGLVVLQDFSDPAPGGASRRYDWIPDISGVRVAPTPEVRTYKEVRKTASNPAAEQIVGRLAYDNMASFGLTAPAGPVRVGAVGAVGTGGSQKDGSAVLMTFDPLPGGTSGASFSVASTAFSAASAPVIDIAPTPISYTKTTIVQVRVFSSASFDAVAIDSSTVRFVIDGVVPGAPVGVRATGAVMTVVQNLNGDAYPDRVFQFQMPALKAAGLSGPNHQFELRGTAASGPFQSSDPTPPPVVDYPAVTQVVISPDSSTISVGGTVDLDVQLFAGATPVSGRTVAWNSLDAAATVNASGLVTGQSAGSARIVATSEGKADTAIVTVTAAGGAPSAVANGYNSTAGTTLTVPDGATDLLANDNLGTPAATLTHFGGGSLGPSVTDNVAGNIVSFGSGGSLQVNANGSFTFTPSAGFTGSFTFQYRITNGSGSSDATVTINVTAGNSAPTAVNDAYSTNQDTPLSVPAATGVLANDSDADGDTLTAVLVSNVTHGTLSLNADGSFSFAPDSGFSGTDQFTYKASDGTADSNVATVVITVNPAAANNAPVAVNDTYTASEDSILTVAAPGVLANDTDADGNALTASLVSNVTHGTLTLNPNGSFTYTPTPNYSGPDQFTYRARDAADSSNVATVSITVTPVNDPPVAANDTFTVKEDSTLTVSAPGVLSNDTDAEGSTLTASLVSNVTHGTLTLNPNGSFTYTPTPNYFGPDQFTYRAGDGTGVSNIATVNITVTPVNDAPVAMADAYNALGNVQAGIPASGVLGNDTDVDDPAASLSVQPGTVSSTNGGTVVLSANGSFTYISAPGYNGGDSFSYTVRDTAGATATGTVTMTVTGRYWFVSDTAAANGDGRQNSKFQSLTPLNGAGGAGDPDQSGDFILVHRGTYSSAIALEGNQQLIGQGITSSLTATVNGQTVTLLAAGSAPTIGSASGNAITLGSGNTLRGFVAGSAPGAAIAGSAVGSLTVAEVSINNASGRALDLTTSGTLSAAFGSISATGGTGNGINLVNQTGTLTSGSTSITNPSGTGIHVQGSGGFSFGTTTVAKGTTTGTGVHLQSNTGTTTFSSLGITTSGGTGLFASSAGTLSVAAGTISATGGPAIDATGTTLSGAGFSSTSSTGSPGRGISLTGVSGTWSLGSGSIGTAAAEDFLVSGGNAGISYAGSIANTANRSVSIAGRTGGTVTLSGSISDTGTGILVQNSTGGAVEFTGAGKVLSTGTNPAVTLATNPGATISFADSLKITTTTGGGFSATGGGTVTVAGTHNSITSAGGVALNVANTTISSGNLNFRSISATGGANGIVLSNTGSTGRLQVTGSGTAGSGGSIQNTTGHGISLTSTTNPSFDRMNLQSNGGSGLFGTGVVGFTLTNSTIATSGTGGGANASNIDFFADTAPGTENNLSGTVVITGNTLSAPAFHNVDIQNWSGTISDLTLSNNVLTNSSTQGGGIRVIAFGGAGNVAKITRATIANNQVTGSMQSPGLQVQCGNATAGGPLGECGTVGSATNVVSITSNQVHGTSAAARIGTEGLLALLNGRGQANFNVSSNDVRHTTGRAMAVSSFGQGTMTSTVNGNTIVANNTFASAGLEIGADSTANMASNGTYTATVTGNNVSQSDGVGIWAIARGSSHTLRVKLQNNTVAAPLSGVRPGLRIDSGSAVGNTTVCANVSGNTSAGSGGHQGIGIRKQGTIPNVNTFGVNGMAATSSPGVESYIVGLNPAGGGVLLLSATSGFTNCSFP